MKSKIFGRFYKKIYRFFFDSPGAPRPGYRIGKGNGMAPQGRRSKSPCENFLFPLDIPKEISYDNQACKAQALYIEEGAP